MGKRSSAAAKEKRAAERLGEQQKEKIREYLATVYTEGRLAEIRSAVRAEFPEIGPSMTVRVVDVLCLQAPATSTPADTMAILKELESELEAHLCESGFEELVEGAASPIHRQTGNQGHRRRARTTRVDSGARRHQYGARTQGVKGAGSSRASSGSATSSSNWGEAASKDASGAKQAGIKDTEVKGTGEEVNSTGAIDTAGAQGYTWTRSGGQGAAVQAQKLGNRRRNYVGRSAAACNTGNRCVV